jgi:hypothetical protein
VRPAVKELTRNPELNIYILKLEEGYVEGGATAETKLTSQVLPL